MGKEFGVNLGIFLWDILKFFHAMSIFETKDMNTQFVLIFLFLIQMNCKETAGHGRCVLRRWKIPRHIKIWRDSGLFLSYCNYLLGFANYYIHDYRGKMTPPGAKGTTQRFFWVLLLFFFNIKNIKFYLQL